MGERRLLGLGTRIVALAVVVAGLQLGCRAGNLHGDSAEAQDGTLAPDGATDAGAAGGAASAAGTGSGGSTGTLLIDGTYSNQKLLIGGPARSWPPAGVDPNPPLGKLCTATLDSQGSVPSLVPRAFYTSCAGCHGPTGLGGHGYPSAHTARTFASFSSVVRAGYTGTIGLMPHFDEGHLNDSDLARIYGYLNQQPVLEAGDCTAEATPDAATLNANYVLGLAAWRSRSASNDNVSCTQCHGVDGLTFAYLGFSDGDILRRAQKHVQEPAMFAILDMVHALRQKYNIVPRDPLVARPLQPGGVLLDGNTTAARDLAFGQQLQAMGLKVANGFINTGADATQAAAELGNVNLHALRIPLAFNHLAEDVFHNDGNQALNCNGEIDTCPDHGSLSDWMPIEQHVPTDFNQYFAVHDAYLANPNLAAFYKVFGQVPDQSTMPGTYPIGYNYNVDDNKYKAQFILDYCIRREVLGLPGCYDTQGLVNTMPFDANQRVNAIWAEGEYANLFGTGLSTQPSCDVGLAPCDPQQAPQFFTKLSAGAKISDSMQRLRANWFAMHWNHFDPTMLNTGDATIQQNEYFARDIFWSNNDQDYAFKALNPTYSIYAAFQVFMRNIQVLKTPSSASCSKIPYTHPDLGVQTCTANDLRSGYYPQLCNFAEGKNWYNESKQQLAYVPTDAARKAIYQTLAGNFYRMFFRGLTNQLQKDNWLCTTDVLKLRIARGQAFLAQAEIVAANGPQDQEMFTTLAALMAKSATRCPALDTTSAAAF